MNLKAPACPSRLTARVVPKAGLSITHTNGIPVKSLFTSSGVTRQRTTAAISAFCSVFSRDAAYSSVKDAILPKHAACLRISYGDDKVEARAQESKKENQPSIPPHSRTGIRIISELVARKTQSCGASESSFNDEIDK